MPEPALIIFSERIRDTDNFTQTARDWMGCPVTYELVSQHPAVLRPCDPLASDVPAGTVVLHRRGLLRALLDGTPEASGVPPESAVVAYVRSVVCPVELSQSARRALAQGKAPLGSVFAPQPVRRHTHAVTRLSAADSHGRQVLQVLATLTVSGRPVATVDEIVYQSLLDNFHGQRHTHRRVGELHWLDNRNAV